MTKPKNDEILISSSSKLRNLSDLSDFCQLWPQIAEQISDNRLAENVSDEDMRILIPWMRRLCDRVAREGLEPTLVGQALPRPRD